MRRGLTAKGPPQAAFSSEGGVGARLHRTGHWQRANRVQPSNSKGGNWWQSPFCGALHRRHFRREAGCEARPHRTGHWQRANRVQPSNSKGGNWWQSPFCGALHRRHFRREAGCEARPHRTGHWQRANRVQPSNSKGGNWWQSPFCGALHRRHFRREAGCEARPHRTGHWQRANRVQPSNSKGGNWWQSPFCGALARRHFRERQVVRRGYIGRGIGKGQTGYSHPIPKAGIGGSPRFAAHHRRHFRREAGCEARLHRTGHWQRANRVQPSNSKGGNWWQSPFCGAP